MRAAELQQLLTASGWECEVRGTEVRLRICYFCGNEKQNLELSAEKGVFHCWACKRGGRLDSFLHTLTGQKHHIPTTARDATHSAPTPAVPQEFKRAAVSEMHAAAHYLSKRGLSAAVAAQYGVCVCLEPGHRLYGRLAVPMRDFWTNALVGWLGRTYTKQTPKYLSTLPHKVITGWRVRDPSVPTLVVEGPFDGIAAHRAGYSVAVLGGTGDAGLQDWAARLSPQAKIIVMLDSDALPQASRLLWQIRAVRGNDEHTVLAVLGAGDDPDSAGPDGIRAAVQAALRSPVPTVSGKPPEEESQ